MRMVAFFLAAVVTADVVAQPITGGKTMRVLHGEKVKDPQSNNKVVFYM